MWSGFLAFVQQGTCTESLTMEWLTYILTNDKEADTVWSLSVHLSVVLCSFTNVSLQLLGIGGCHDEGRKIELTIRDTLNDPGHRDGSTIEHL